MVFRKLGNFVQYKQRQLLQRKGETANILPTSDDDQPEPTLLCRLRSLSTVVEVFVTVVTNKGRQRKTQISESEGDEGHFATATVKDCKRKRQNPEIQDYSYPFELVIHQFDKRFEGIQKKLQQPSKKLVKIEDNFKREESKI